METSAENIVDGEKDKRMGYRKHQTRMDTGVEGDEGVIFAWLDSAWPQQDTWYTW